MVPLSKLSADGHPGMVFHESSRDFMVGGRLEVSLAHDSIARFGPRIFKISVCDEIGDRRSRRRHVVDIDIAG